MYAIVNHVDGHGVTVVHTRKTQEAANDLGVQMAVEQTTDPNVQRSPQELKEFEDGVRETLQEHGVWIDGQQFSVTVIEVSTQS